MQNNEYEFTFLVSQSEGQPGKVSSESMALVNGTTRIKISTPELAVELLKRFYCNEEKTFFLGKDFTICQHCGKANLIPVFPIESPETMAFIDAVADKQTFLHNGEEFSTYTINGNTFKVEYDEDYEDDDLDEIPFEEMEKDFENLAILRLVSGSIAGNTYLNFRKELKEKYYGND